MDEGAKQVIIVAIAVVVGIALIALFAADGDIMEAIGAAIQSLITKVTTSATQAG